MAKLMDEREMVRILLRLAHEILEKNKQTEDLILIGIQRRGAPLAERISKLIKEIKGKEVPTGSLDITFYRDDLTRIGYHPVVRDTNRKNRAGCSGSSTRLWASSENRIANLS